MRQATIYDFIPKCETHCEICGNLIEVQGRFKPKKYCSEQCSAYAKFKDALERAIIKMKPTKEATSLIRGDLFRMANILSKRTVS